MRPDPEYLRQHYSMLSDDALLAVERSELVEVAQTCYDAELSRRGLARPADLRSADVPQPVSMEVENIDEDDWPADDDELETADEPEWLADATEVFSAIVHPGRNAEEHVAEARQVLRDAGIPSYLERVELTSEEKAPVSGTHRWRLMAPWKLRSRAVSTLEREFANPDFEAGWRSFLESCEDEDLPGMHPQVVFCDLYDRIDRVTKAYHEELARRGLKAG